MFAFLLLVAGLIGVELTRRWLLQRPVPPPPSEPFAGVHYPVGSATVSERATAAAPRATVICMPGYCENVRYFTRAYADPDIQLILVSSAGYYTGLDGGQVQQAAWAHPPDAPEGSIEYDAMVLNQALEHLPRSDRIRVHGHSRGGAVVLEAAARRPELFQGVEVILEAPVLPQASLLLQPIPRFFYWLFPLLLPLWQAMPLPPVTLGRWGTLRDPRKRELIASFPFNARRGSILLANLRSVEAWMRNKPVQLYRHLDRGTILIPEDDQVLDAASMARSASHAEPRLTVVEVRGASHFILLDEPQSLPPLRAEGEDDALRQA